MYCQNRGETMKMSVLIIIQIYSSEYGSFLHLKDKIKTYKMFAYTKPHVKAAYTILTPPIRKVNSKEDV